MKRYSITADRRTSQKASLTYLKYNPILCWAQQKESFPVRRRYFGVDCSRIRKHGALYFVSTSIDSDCPNSWIFHTDIVPFRLVFSCFSLPSSPWYSSHEIYLSDASENGAETIDNMRKTRFTFSLRLIIWFTFAEFKRTVPILMLFIDADTLNIVHFDIQNGIQATKYLIKNLLCYRKTGWGKTKFRYIM